MTDSSASTTPAAELFRAAIAADDSGRRDEAEAQYRQVLALAPLHAGAHYRLGLVACRRGQVAAGLEHIGRAIALNPASAEYRRDLGLVLSAVGRLVEAERSYREALQLDPSDAQAHNALGNLLGRTGRFADAAAAYRAAVRLRPGELEPYCNLAQVLFLAGQADDAVAVCRDALRHDPTYVEAHNHLGNLFTALGRMAEAESCFREAVRLNPNFAPGHRNLGDVMANLQRFEPAVESYRRALLLDPKFPRSWNHLGVALACLGRADEANTCFERALRLQPDMIAAQINRCMGSLRVLYRDEAEIEAARAAYAAGLDALSRQRTPATEAELGGTEPPFLLAYQGRSDRALQAQYGSFVARMMADLHPRWTTAPVAPPPQPGEPIRVGILSAYFYDHSNWKIPIKGWLAGLDKRRFQLFGYHVGRRRDAETEIARSLCHRFVEGLPTTDHWAAAIRNDRLHVLLIPGIGMDSDTVNLAALRLAPVQATSWGHPDTSGLPTIDDFLSSALMEPTDGEAHYTERLVRLPNLSVWYEPLALEPPPLSRDDIGVPAGTVLYWCCQSLFKYLPRFDVVFPRIAAAVPDARFLFIEYRHGGQVTGIFRERLAAAFAAAGLDADRHCLFVPPMSPARFAAISRLADIFLDSLGWSGCNSTFEALAHDLPVVTMAGDLMRGRHSAAILTMLGLPELVAHDPDGFVALAVELGLDPARRAALVRRIAGGKHRLYRDQATIDGLSAYLEAAARRRQ
jgi:predicted O-linked N-acetylglucosamine transferase (SPINDLY family)